MIYTHTIGRIGAKDCRVITGTHGTFMAVDIAVDDYSKGKQITTWVRVKSSKENHIRLAEYLTKGRMVLVEGTLTSSIWTDRNGENHIQHSIIADSIAFVNAGKAFDNGQMQMQPTHLQQRHARQPRQRARLPYRQPMHRRTRAKTFPSEDSIN